LAPIKKPKLLPENQLQMEQSKQLMVPDYQSAYLYKSYPRRDLPLTG